jgi:hypothetical protein
VQEIVQNTKESRLDRLLYDTKATEQRFKDLRRYCEQEAHIDPSKFDCDFVKFCEGEVGSRGLHLVKGGLAHVGEDYDVRFDGKELRIMFVGYDQGNCCAGLEEYRQSIQCFHSAINPHYKGIIKVMMEVFQQECDSETDKHLWKPLLRRMVQTNATRCCAPREGSNSRRTMACNTTEDMRRKCWPHFKREIEILKPTIMFFHGASLKTPFMDDLKRDGVSCEPLDGELGEHCYLLKWTWADPFESVVLFFNHPAPIPIGNRHNFGSQWDKKVVSVLNKLRTLGMLPTLNSAWVPRQRKDWPKI